MTIFFTENKMKTILFLCLFFTLTTIAQEQVIMQNREEIINSFMENPRQLSKIDDHSLTMAVIDFYLEDYNKKNNSLLKREDIVSKIRELGTTKQSLEEKIKLQNSRIIYDSEAVNPLTYLFSGHMQCYSGTVLTLLARRLNGGSDQNQMVIFRPNHVLPGKIEDKNLTGIETTVEGKGLMKFGPVEKLHEDTLVIDEKTFLISELLDSHPNQMLVKMRLGLMSVLNNVRFELADVDPKINPAIRCYTEKDGLPFCQLNQSYFGHGDGKIPVGTFKRNTFDEVDCVECNIKTISVVQPNIENAIDLKKEVQEAIWHQILGRTHLYFEREQVEKLSKILVENGVYFLPSTLTSTSIEFNHYTNFLRQKTIKKEYRFYRSLPQNIILMEIKALINGHLEVFSFTPVSKEKFDTTLSLLLSIPFSTSIAERPHLFFYGSEQLKNGNTYFYGENDYRNFSIEAELIETMLTESSPIVSLEADIKAKEQALKVNHNIVICGESINLESNLCVSEFPSVSQFTQTQISAIIAELKALKEKNDEYLKINLNNTSNETLLLKIHAVETQKLLNYYTSAIY